MAVSSLGAGSGLPLNQLLADLVAAEAIPLTVLRNKSTSVQSQVSAYGQVRSSLAALQTALGALDDSKFTSFKAASSEATVASVTANSEAKAFSGKLEVTNLATASKVISAPLTDVDGEKATKSSVIGSGELKFVMGTSTAGSTTFTPSTDPNDHFTVKIDPSKNTLEGIRDSVNAAKGPVTAAIINDASGARLVFTSTETGQDNNFWLTATNADGTSTGGLTQFDFNPTDPTGGPTTRTMLGVDAKFELDGVALSSASNAVSDMIDGLSFTLLKEGTTTLSTTKDSSAPKAALKAVADAYNKLHDQVKAYTTPAPQDPGSDPSTRNDPPLTGDPTIRNIMEQLRDQIFQPLPGAADPYNSFTSLGMTFDRDGKLSLNETIFDKAITDEPDALRTLFKPTDFGSETRSLSQRFTDSLERITNETDGLLTNRVDGLDLTTKSLKTQQEALERRVAAVEARYRAQFVALDVALSSMTNTRNALTQQLDALNKLNG